MLRTPSRAKQDRRCGGRHRSPTKKSQKNSRKRGLCHPGASRHLGCGERIAWSRTARSVPLLANQQHGQAANVPGKRSLIGRELLAQDGAVEIEARVVPAKALLLPLRVSAPEPF